MTEEQMYADTERANVNETHHLNMKDSLKWHLSAADALIQSKHIKIYYPHI